MGSLLSLMAATDSSSGGSGVDLSIAVVIIVIAVVAWWKVYTKAGKPGWAAIIPFYNIYVLLKIVNRPGWWLILYFIPIVNIIVQLIVAIDLAKAFGKSTLFGVVGLWLFSIIGFLILAFGNAEYHGGNAVSADAVAAPAPEAAPTTPDTPVASIETTSQPAAEATPPTPSAGPETPTAPAAPEKQVTPETPEAPKPPTPPIVQ